MMARMAAFLLSTLITAPLALLPNGSVRLVVLIALGALMWLNHHARLTRRASRRLRAARPRQHTAQRAATALRRSWKAGRNIDALSWSALHRLSDARRETCLRWLLVIFIGLDSPLWQHPSKTWRRARTALTIPLLGEKWLSWNRRRAALVMTREKAAD
jgi:hypothetical protein